MSSQSLEKDDQKDMDTLPSLSEPTSTTPAAASSAPTTSLDLVDDEPDWPQTWRAYACLLGCFFLMFNSWGLVNAYGTWSSYYIGHSLRELDQLELNLNGSTQSFLVLLFSNPVGRLLDAGHSRIVIGCGSVLVPLGLFLLSVVHPQDAEAKGRFGNIWSTQGLVVGIGMGAFFVSSSQGEFFKLLLQLMVISLTCASGVHVVPETERPRGRLCCLWCQCCWSSVSFYAAPSH